MAHLCPAIEKDTAQIFANWDGFEKTYFRELALLVYFWCALIYLNLPFGEDMNSCHSGKNPGSSLNRN